MAHNESRCAPFCKACPNGVDLHTAAYLCSGDCSEKSGFTRRFPLRRMKGACCGVMVCPCVPLRAVCPPGDLPGPHSSHPAVPGSHGDLARGRHHHLQASSERCRGANDRLETVTRVADAPSHCTTQPPAVLPRSQGADSCQTHLIRLDHPTLLVCSSSSASLLYGLFTCTFNSTF